VNVCQAVCRPIAQHRPAHAGRSPRRLKVTMVKHMERDAYSQLSRWAFPLKAILGPLLVLVLFIGLGLGIRTTLVVSSLRRLGPEHAALIPYAQKQLHSTLSLVRGAAARSLGQIGAPAVAAVPELLACLESDSPQVACEAAWSLGAIGSAQSDVVGGLVAALKHNDGEVRRYAAFALSCLGNNAMAAVPELTGMLSDKGMAYMAARALGDIGSPARESIPQIGELLSSMNMAERAESAIALSKLTPLPAEIVAQLSDLLGDPDTLVRESARKALQANSDMVDQAQTAEP
jgi:HEAT repeat protein